MDLLSFCSSCSGVSSGPSVVFFFIFDPCEEHIEGSQPEWCIWSMIYSGDIPVWSETLDIDLCSQSCGSALAATLVQSATHQSVRHGKNLNASLCVAASQPSSFTSPMLIGTNDVCHFIPFSVALTLVTRGLIHETDLRAKLRPKPEVRNYRRKVAIHESRQREVAT